MKYYIAYGSNINKEQMDLRCPNNKVIRTILLKGYQLVFHKYLTVELSKYKKCPAVIYQISESDEKTLDINEGVHLHIYRKEYINVEIEGKNINCLIYIMNYLPNRRNVSPSRLYFNKCLEGYKRFGFDTNYLYRAKNCNFDNIKE